MKKLLYLSIFIYFSSSYTLIADDRPVQLNSTITGLTVFFRGAEIQRTATFQIKQGQQQVVFEGLPEDINPQSIQVEGIGNFTILSVMHRFNYLQNSLKSKDIILLEDSLQLINRQLAQQNAKIAEVHAEQEMLKANQYTGGANTGVKITELREFSNYFRAQLSDLSNRRLSIQVKIEDLQKQRERIEKQLQSLQSNPQRPASEILVDLLAPTIVKATLTLSYFTRSAGWRPQYDLRCSELNQPIELTCKARVFQSTGEEWREVKPVFSTGNPTQHSTKPNLTPWYLSFYEPIIPRTAHLMAVQSLEAPMKSMKVAMADDTEMPQVNAATSADFTTIKESQINVEFSVNLPYNIAGNGQEHTVELVKHSLPAIYEYYAVPKLDKEVFLVAKTTGWEKLNLLEGNANIFFEGKYVGESLINPYQTDDTLLLSLGRDKNITTARTRKKDFSEKQFFGAQVAETREWEFSIHNKKRQSITIVVEDQVPVSTDKEIKIEIADISSAQHDESTGKLTWRYELKPAETQSMILKYIVRHPKNRKIILE